MHFTLLGWGNAGWRDEFLHGMLMTFAVATGAFLLTLVFGTIFAAAKLARFRSLHLVGEIYTTMLRGIPELLVIYLVFFGSGMFLRTMAKGLFGFEGYTDPPVFIVGIFCIGLSAGAYATEVIRGAVLTIPKGEVEAAKAIGMSTALRFRRILVPQAARFALPGLGNIWQFTLKETSLISIVGLVEIMRAASFGAVSTRQPFTFYITAFILFLFLASVSSRGFLMAEKWASRGVRR